MEKLFIICQIYKHTRNITITQESASNILQKKLLGIYCKQYHCSYMRIQLGIIGSCKYM